MLHALLLAAFALSITPELAVCPPGGAVELLFTVSLKKPIPCGGRFVWLWPDGTKSEEQSDCLPDGIGSVPRPRVRWYGPGEHVFRLKYETPKKSEQVQRQVVIR